MKSKATEMSSKASAILRLSFDSEKQLDAILDALQPEAEASPTHRSSVKLEKDGAALTLTAEAADTVALRATVNSYLHWIQSILKVLGTVKK
jgi:KEOPS complex subunit Pcc1